MRYQRRVGILAVIFLFLLPVGVVSTTPAPGKGSFYSARLREQALEMSGPQPYLLLVYHFFERYVGELMQMSPGDKRNERMELDGVRIEAGSPEALRQLGDTPSLHIVTGDKRYNISVACGSKLLLDLSFPKSCQLLTGLDKTGLEELFVMQVSGFDSLRHSTPLLLASSTEFLSENLRPTHLAGYFILPGGSYHTELIRSDRYYGKQGDTYRPVCCREHPMESLVNLLLEENTPGNHILELDIRKYGFRRESLYVPLKSWLAYCRYSGCECYVGIEGWRDSRLEATLFVVNEPLGYNHILNFSVDTDVFLNQNDTVKAITHIYIPTEAIKNLFDEYRPGRNRQLMQGLSK